VAQPIFSTRFLAQHDLAVGLTATYTVPVGFVAVVRDIDVYNGTAEAGTVNALGSASQVFWSESWSIVNAGWRMWRGRSVLYAGEVLTLESDVSVIDVTASGYLLVI
jgi:hypothetical protein